MKWDTGHNLLCCDTGMKNWDGILGTIFVCCDKSYEVGYWAQHVDAVIQGFHIFEVGYETQICYAVIQEF